MDSIHDNDMIIVTTRRRIRGGFGDFERSEMTVRAARALRARCAGRTYANTKPGDVVLIGVTGTLSQIYASGAPLKD